MKKIIISLLLAVALVFSLCGCLSAYRDVPSDVGRNSYAVSEYRTTMEYKEDFKILQLTDLHLGIECDLRDQLELIKKDIRESEPDLIILTGDIFMYANKDIVRALISTVNDECRLLTEKREGRLTKFAYTFGNHDNQGDYPRYFINSVIQSYATEDGREIEDSRYAAFVDYEDDNIFGLTNYYIDIVDDRTKSPDTVDVKYRIHIIDSNTYHFMGLDYDYDVIHEDQLLHAKKIYDTATADKDYIGMAFFHIPLVEYEEAYQQFLASGETTGEGKYQEKHLPGYENNGAFDMLRSANIISYFCGHDHKNNGDIIYNADSADIAEKAIFSYGVKATNLLYHTTELIGYKTVTLKENMTKEEFLTVENILANFKNERGGYAHYED